MTDSYPGKKTDDSIQGDRVTVSFLEKSPPTELSVTIKDKWDASYKDKSELLNTVDLYVSTKLAPPNAYADEVLGNSEVVIGSSDVESFVDLTLRNLLPLLEKCEYSSFDELKGTEFLGQVMANLGALYGEGVHQQESIGYTTPGTLDKESVMKILGDIQSHANSHKGIQGNISAGMLRLHTMQLVSTSIRIVNEFVKKADMAEDGVFNPNSGYILSNLGGIVALGRNIKNPLANLEVSVPKNEVVEPSEETYIAPDIPKYVQLGLQYPIGMIVKRSGSGALDAGWVPVERIDQDPRISADKEIVSDDHQIVLRKEGVGHKVLPYEKLVALQSTPEAVALYNQTKDDMINRAVERAKVLVGEAFDEPDPKKEELNNLINQLVGKEMTDYHAYTSELSRLQGMKPGTREHDVVYSNIIQRGKQLTPRAKAAAQLYIDLNLK